MTMQTKSTIVLHRVRKPKEQKTAVLRIRIETYNQVEALAEESGMKLSQVASYLLTEAVKLVEVKD